MRPSPPNRAEAQPRETRGKKLTQKLLFLFKPTFLKHAAVKLLFSLILALLIAIDKTNDQYPVDALMKASNSLRRLEKKIIYPLLTIFVKLSFCFRKDGIYLLL